MQRITLNIVFMSTASDRKQGLEMSKTGPGQVQ